ncbi:MAG: type IV pilin protein, partial [Gammaproteobacteria bacterium]|nr:type IV pilin protein [Gammaproteobacteria bacterium]
LMIVVAIVGILAAIAYPSYQEQVRKSRRADANGALLGLANAMQRHATDNGTYLGAATGGGDDGAPAIYATQSPVDGGTAYYNLTIAATPTQTTFELNATPTTAGGQNNYMCGTLTLTHTGAKGVSGADTGVGWEDCW